MTEAELIVHLKSKYLPDCEKADDVFNTWDVRFTHRLVKYYGELKCREDHYDSLLIEEDKYRRLLSLAAVNHRSAAYINSTPEGIFGWDLNKRPEPIWEKRLMPATTQFENTEKVWKSVGYLPANEESRFK